ncbi:MAG: MarC family protein [Chloroflexi bacterium]|jgi:multiple antibiotic resistance protein|nr:MarC family protein [Chloroflexota bacterium]
MDFSDIDFYLIFDLFLLLLIGMGPKIALVPFLDLTRGMEAETQKQVANRMVRTAVVTALLLVALGWFLMRLLHFTPGAANVAGGIILLLLALHMLLSPAKKTEHHEDASGRDALQMAIYPLAVPYLLNPAGIATLVVASSEIDTILTAVMVFGLVLLIAAIDFAVFRNMDKLAKHLEPSRLVITEAVFGVLLAALAIQLMVDGLAELGVVTTVAH